MRLRRWLLPGLAFSALFLLAGCAGPTGGTAAGPQRAPTDFSSRRILDTTIGAVRPVAARVFQDVFQLDTEASTGLVLVARPVEVTGRGEATSIRDRLTLSPDRQRQMAELRLQQEGPNVIVQCSILTQRLRTAERAAFAREIGDDRPGDTPIDRRGYTSAAPREEWMTVGRDRKTEQEILGRIEEALAGTRPAP